MGIKNSLIKFPCCNYLANSNWLLNLHSKQSYSQKLHSLIIITIRHSACGNMPPWCVFSLSRRFPLSMSEITLITLHLFIGRRAFRLCDGLFLPKASWVKHERSSASKQVFPLEAPRRTSALEHLGMAGNSPSPERDVLRMLFKHFRGMSRAEPSRAEPSRATFAPQKN